MLRQLACDRLRQRDNATAGARLGWPEVVVAVDLDEDLCDFTLGVERVEPPSAQPEELARTEAAVPADQHECPVSRANDPRLGLLADNGGPTQTQLPQTGSPSIDAIPNDACQTAPLATGITTDQRQLARPKQSGGKCDIGAVEVQLPPAPAPALQVTRSVAVPGEMVTISGTGCITDEVSGPRAAVTIAGVVAGNVAFTPPLSFGPINAEADGTWSTTIVVPAGTPPGTYAMNATCTLVNIAEVSAQASGTFQYAPGSLTIAMTVTPKFTG